MKTWRSGNDYCFTGAEDILVCMIGDKMMRMKLDSQTDIVEKLRLASSKPKRNEMTIGEYWNLCDESADEIERLRNMFHKEVELRLADRERAERAEAALARVGTISGTTVLCAYPSEIATARRDALEEAAIVAEELINVPHGDGTHTAVFRHFGNKQVAAAIRALAAKEST